MNANVTHLSRLRLTLDQIKFNSGFTSVFTHHGLVLLICTLIPAWYYSMLAYVLVVTLRKRTDTINLP